MYALPFVDDPQLDMAYRVHSQAADFDALGDPYQADVARAAALVLCAEWEYALDCEEVEAEALDGYIVDIPRPRLPLHLRYYVGGLLFLLAPIAVAVFR